MFGLAVHCDLWSRSESFHSTTLYEVYEVSPWKWDQNTPYRTATSQFYELSTSLYNDRQSPNWSPSYSRGDPSLYQSNGDGGRLTKGLLVQLDNCVCENKNQFLLSCLEFLVLWKIFDQVEVSFLPVGNTHTDIYQTFSTTSELLHHTDAITLQEMQKVLSQCYNTFPKIYSTNHVVNWSGLCTKFACNNRINNVTHYRYLRFTPVQHNETSISCEIHLRSSVDDNWQLESLKNNNLDHFRIRFLPDLSKTPAEELVSPTYWKSVTNPISSEEGRIQDPDIISALYHLRDDVYQYRKLRLYWDMNNDIESKGIDRSTILSKCNNRRKTTNNQP